MLCASIWTVDWLLSIYVKWIFWVPCIYILYCNSSFLSLFLSSFFMESEFGNHPKNMVNGQKSPFMTHFKNYCYRQMRKRIEIPSLFLSLWFFLVKIDRAYKLISEKFAAEWLLRSMKKCIDKKKLSGTSFDWECDRYFVYIKCTRSDFFSSRKPFQHFYRIKNIHRQISIKVTITLLIVQISICYFFCLFQWC